MRFQPADLAVGLDALEGLALAAGKTQQHAAQAKSPAVLLATGRQAQAGALPGVQAPADAGAADPLSQARQIGRLQAEAQGQARHIEQIAQLAGGAARLRQAQQPLQRHHQRVVAALAEVGNVEGNVARIAARVLAKDRADGRRKALDIGQHDDDVARLQLRQARRWRRGQQAQQLVVQDLDLALGTVGDVEDDGTVLYQARLGRTAAVAGMLGQGHQVADAGLHLLQQATALAFRGSFIEEVDLGRGEAGLGLRRVVKGIERPHKIAALAAPGGQQGVGVGMHFLQGQLGQITALAQGLAAALLAQLLAQQLAAVDDVGPVVAAGVGQGQDDLAMAGQGGQGLQGLLRYMGHAEQNQAARQATRRLALVLQRPHEALVQHRPRAGPLHRRERLQQGAPEPGLPALIGRQRRGLAQVQLFARRGQLGGQHIVAEGPSVQPVAAVDLVLVVQVSQALGQLQAPVQTAALQKISQRRVDLGRLRIRSCR